MGSSHVNPTGQINLVPTGDGKYQQVVLNAAVFYATSTSTPSERSAEFREEIDRRKGTNCLIRGDMITIARSDGVSLFAQAKEIAQENNLSGCYVIAHFEQKLYVLEIDRFGIPDPESEDIINEGDFVDRINISQTDVYAIGPTPIEEIDEIDAVLHLKGKQANPYRLLPEVQAFGQASVPHPARFKKPIMLGIGLVILLGIGLLYYLYTEDVKRKEAEARAQAVPPPLTTSDMCVPQLQAYSKLLDTDLAYLLHNGATTITIAQGKVSAKGRPLKASHKIFSNELKKRGVGAVALSGSKSEDRIPKEGRNQSAYSLLYDTQVEWYVPNYREIIWKSRPAFGIRNYAEYSVSLFHKFDRMGVAYSFSNMDLTTTTDGRSIREGAINVQGELFTSFDLQKLTKAFLGVPARCDKLEITRDLTTEKIRFDLSATYRGLE